MPVPTARAAQPSQLQDAAGEQHGVLMLSVDDFSRPYVRQIFEGFSDAVLESPETPAIYFETLDRSRFDEPEYANQVRSWFQRKYADTRVDLVVTLGEDSLGFLLHGGDLPWPGARLLYFESGNVRFDVEAKLHGAGGLLLEDNVDEALQVIRTVLPHTRQVALVSGGSPAERMRWRLMGTKVQQAGLQPIDLGGKSMPATLDAVSQLPDRTVILILAPIVDAQGHVLSTTRTCADISAAANAPTFALGSQYLGCGVVGGRMRDWSTAGRLIGEEALARLRRPSSDVVRVPVNEYTVLAFDARQLDRWSIPERALPSGAVIRFREPSVWRDHRALILSALGVTLLQSVLIAGLVIERRRRRKAELEGRRHLSAMAHLDRRAAMGELATSLAHELSQPLNAILQNAGAAQMLLASHPAPAALGDMADIIGDIRKDDIRATEVIRRMRGLLQKHEMERRPLDLNEVARDTLAVVSPEARSRGIQLHLDTPNDVRPATGDRVHLQQVVLNLLMNAMDAVQTMPGERRQVRVSTAEINGHVRLEVADSGPGLPVGYDGQIFEPFFTTKGASQGMGMGLPIARSIVEAHAGLMGAGNNSDGGATVWFSIPCSAPHGT
jgi:signal transduction histidine kinase